MSLAEWRTVIYKVDVIARDSEMLSIFVNTYPTQLWEMVHNNLIIRRHSFVFDDGVCSMFSHYAAEVAIDRQLFSAISK